MFTRILFASLLAMLTVVPAGTARNMDQGGRGGPAAVIPTEAIPIESPLAARLARVPDIRVETVVGELPRLPYTIPAVHRDKTKGPAVRVIWPAPKDNSQVMVPGTYVTLSRDWRENDTIELRMPFRFYLEPLADQPSIASIFYGPVLLAAEEPGPRTDWRRVVLDAGDIGKSITGDPATLRFSVDGTVLKPFYETSARYSV